MIELLSENDKSLEVELSRHARELIRRSAPGLLDYPTGFRLLDKNRDNTRVSGVFGVQLGDQWVYVPIFFVNGIVRGSGLLYLNDQDCFISMSAVAEADRLILELFTSEPVVRTLELERLDRLDRPLHTMYVRPRLAAMIAKAETQT